MQKRLFLVLTLMAFFLSLGAYAGPAKEMLPLKIGYADIEYIADRLPEMTRVRSELASLRKQYVNRLEAKGKEFQQEGQAFFKGGESMTAAERSKKELKLQQLENSLKKMQREAEQKLANKQAALLNPLYEKIHKAIEQVAKDQGYTYVFNTNVGGAPILLYANEKYNTSDLVLKKLGVKLPKGKKK